MNAIEMLDSNQSGFVQFGTIEAANTALSKDEHLVTNCNMKVKEADPWKQPEHILNALNDDCLLKVFSFLKLNDLARTSDVCVRFNRLAKDVFVTKFKRLKVSFRDCNLYCFEKVLRNFGHLIFSLYIDGAYGYSDHELVFEFMNEYTMPQLKQLTLRRFRLGKNVDINSTLSNLEHLELILCSVYDLSAILEYCIGLKLLKIVNLKLDNKPSENIVCLPIRRIHQKFEKLEDIHFIDGLSEHELNNLIPLNAPLKKLVVVNNRITRSLVPLLIKHHQHLEELVLYQYLDRNSQEILHEQLESFNDPLKSLKTLKLDFDLLIPSTIPSTISIEPLLRMLATKNVPIEEFVLKACRVVHHFEVSTLTQLKRIRSLKLLNIDGFTDEHVIELARNLPQLQKLVLGVFESEITGNAIKNAIMHATKLLNLTLGCRRSLTIDVGVYNEILEAVRARPDERNLSINISKDFQYPERDVLLVDEETLRKNCVWLQIDKDFLFSDYESYSENDYCDFSDVVVDDYDDTDDSDQYSDCPSYGCLGYGDHYCTE